MKNSIIFLIISMILVISLTGCQVKSSDLDQEQEDKVAEYSANLLLRYSYTYDKTLVAIKETQPVTLPIMETISNQENDNNDSDNSDKDNTTEKPLNIVLGLDNYEVTFSGYTLLSSYPEAEAEDSSYIMTAAEGAKLLILKFSIQNATTEALSANMQEKGLSYVANINNSISAKAKLTVFLNALNTYTGSLNPSESKELILVYQIAEEIADNINSIQLGTSQGSVTLK